MWANEASASPMDWNEAVAYCKRSNLAGFTDWRLADAKELKELFGRMKSSEVGFKNLPANDPKFWSAQLSVESSFQAWAVNMSDTSVKEYSPDDKLFALCVRWNLAR